MPLTEIHDCAPADTSSQTGGDEPAAPRNSGEHRSRRNGRRNTGEQAPPRNTGEHDPPRNTGEQAPPRNTGNLVTDCAYKWLSWLMNLFLEWLRKFLKKNWPFVLVLFFLCALYAQDLQHAALQTKQVAELNERGDLILDSCCNMEPFYEPDASSWDLHPILSGWVRLITIAPNSPEKCRRYCQKKCAIESQYKAAEREVKTILHLVRDPTFLIENHICKLLYTYFEVIFLVAYSVVMCLVCTKYKNRRHNTRFRIICSTYLVLLAWFVHYQVWQYHRKIGLLQVATVHEWQHKACQKVQHAPEALHKGLLKWGIRGVLNANCKLD